MHSNIYQICSSPISEDEYASPSRYEENSGDFADYIGGKIEGEDRKDVLENFGNIVSPVFEATEAEGVFRYMGKEAMREFKQAWCDELKRKAAELTPDNMFKDMRLFRLAQLTEKTHLDASSRVDIDGEGVAYPLGELFEWADHALNEGDCIYIGAVIDYHY